VREGEENALDRESVDLGSTERLVAEGLSLIALCVERDE
jgi:hypothetical protein